jgi:hypothetical protein
VRGVARFELKCGSCTNVWYLQPFLHDVAEYFGVSDVEYQAYLIWNTWYGLPDMVCSNASGVLECM